LLTYLNYITTNFFAPTGTMASSATNALESNSVKPASTTMSKVFGIKQGNKHVDRLAVIIIMENDRDTIIPIHVKKGNYHKLPGGGVGVDEDYYIAGKREVLEGTGCEVVVESECIAVAEEWRNNLHQISYCYRAQWIQGTGSSQFTEMEPSEGPKHGWVLLAVTFEEIMACEPTSELGNYIKEGASSMQMIRDHAIREKLLAPFCPFHRKPAIGTQRYTMLLPVERKVPRRLTNPSDIHFDGSHHGRILKAGEEKSALSEVC
jgi:8-oxo-dGTP diphosphatase